MAKPQPVQAHATVSASGPRRIFGVSVMSMLGLVLLWTCFNAPPAELAFTVFLLVVAFVSLYGAWRMWDATERTLILDEDGLHDDAGLVLSPWDNMEKVERGMLAFKPSNGFILTLKSRGPRRWAPGLYWQLGRKIGVGGVTAAAQAKVMADVIALKLAERDGA